MRWSIASCLGLTVYLKRLGYQVMPLKSLLRLLKNPSSTLTLKVFQKALVGYSRVHLIQLLIHS